MSQKYLQELVQAAQKEMPLLKYDLQNASTHFALQAATVKLFNLTTYILHHLIHAAYENDSPTQQQVPTPPPPPPVVVTPPPPPPIFAQNPSGHAQSRTIPRLPDPSMIEQASPTQEQLPNMAEINIQPGVANVVITPQGTRVIAPSGAATILPQGEAVDLAATTGRPEVPPAPPGYENIVLPPGGGITPDVAAALGARQNPIG